MLNGFVCSGGMGELMEEWMEGGLNGGIDGGLKEKRLNGWMHGLKNVMKESDGRLE